MTYDLRVLHAFKGDRKRRTMHEYLELISIALLVVHILAGVRQSTIEKKLVKLLKGKSGNQKEN